MIKKILQWSVVFVAMAVSLKLTNAETASGMKKPVVFSDIPTLSEVVVRDSVKSSFVGGSATSEGTTRLYEGKKTRATDFSGMPSIQSQNLRQAFSRTPGLLVSEQQSQAFVNTTYRGIGDPHESGYVLTLVDGIPVTSDWHGYNTVYYTPPLDNVERLEVISGGASLLYGPQPGAALNYVTYLPPTDREFTAKTKHVFGSYGYYNTYNRVGGTVEDLGYTAYYSHSQWDGPRINSDYATNTCGFKLIWNTDRDTKIKLSYSNFNNEAGEPGGLTVTEYGRDRDKAARTFDRVWIEKHGLSLSAEHQISMDTLLTSTLFGGYQDRFSRRQTSATAVTTNLDRQEFYTFGNDTRVKHYWEGFGGVNTLTGGFTAYTSDSPRTRDTGRALSLNDATPVFRLERSVNYGSIFAENQFKWGNFGVTPGMRVELVDVYSKENFNTARQAQGGALIDVSHFEAVPLVALGMTYDLPGQNQAYLNVSQGYRTVAFDELFNPTSVSVRSGSSLESGKTWTYELGVKGSPTSYWTYDTSIYIIDNDNVISTVTLPAGNSENFNAGRAIYRGWEWASEFNLVGLYDSLHSTAPGSKEIDRSLEDRIGSLSLFASVNLMNSQFVSGVRDGKEPQYAPEYQLKYGLDYRYQKRGKVTLGSTMLADHFSNDTNSDLSATLPGTQVVPSYMVWDLTAEWKVYKDYVTLLAGINNLFDEDYYSRVRGTGIEPALGRNYYVGFSIEY
jgi:Fe(3+) dicitrate transport protein